MVQVNEIGLYQTGEDLSYLKCLMENISIYYTYSIYLHIYPLSNKDIC